MKRQQTMKIVTALALAAGFAFSATHPAIAVQTFSVVTCALATPTPCVGGTNTSTGPGVQGISSLGFGNVGQTKFNSTSTTNAKAGILGQDLSTTGINDEGVRGTSVRGLGVHGISSSRSGVRGDATSAQGVFGSSSSNTGVQGVSVTGAGVVGQSTSTTGHGDAGDFAASGTGNGVTASAAHFGLGGAFTSASGTGVSGSSNGSGTGVIGSSASGVGVLGFGSTGVESQDRGGSTNDNFFANGIGGRLFRANNSHGLDVYVMDDTGRITATGPITVGGPSNGTGLLGIAFSSGVHGVLSGTLGGLKAGVVGDNTSDGSSTAVYANGFGGFLFVGNNSSGSNVFTVDDAGNVHAHSFTADLAASARTTASGVTSQTAVPSLEDYGEARLSGGAAYVPLRSSFGSSIDHSQPYLVFITPQGSVRGTLYVAQKDARGFTVREAGGASSVAFDYRIVAKEYAGAPVRTLNQPATSLKKRIFAPAIHKTPKIRLGLKSAQ